MKDEQKAAAADRDRSQTVIIIMNNNVVLFADRNVYREKWDGKKKINDFFRMRGKCKSKKDNMKRAKVKYLNESSQKIGENKQIDF